MKAARAKVRDVGHLSLLLCFAPLATAQDSTSGYGPPTAVSPNESIIHSAALPPLNWIDQTQSQADAKSAGCLQCHNGIEPMHAATHVVLGCIDCHGGNPARGLTKKEAHVPPRNPEFWTTSANPPRSDVWLN